MKGLFSMNEIQTKTERIQDLMASNQLDALVLKTTENVAWATDG